jgi:hypothetical protein
MNLSRFTGKTSKGKMPKVKILKSEVNISEYFLAKKIRKANS